MLIFVTAVTLALVVSFLCSIFESVMLSISPARVEALASEGRRSGRILKDFKRHIDVPIAAILIVNTIAHTIGATRMMRATQIMLGMYLSFTAVLLGLLRGEPRVTDGNPLVGCGEESRHPVEHTGVRADEDPTLVALHSLEDLFRRFIGASDEGLLEFLPSIDIVDTEIFDAAVHSCGASDSGLDSSRVHAAGAHTVVQHVELLAK